MTWPFYTTTSNGDAAAVLVSAAQESGLNVGNLSGLAQVQLAVANLLQADPTMVDIPAGNIASGTFGANIPDTGNYVFPAVLTVTSGISVGRNATGADTAASNVVAIAGPASTGNATPATIFFQSTAAGGSGSTSQTLINVLGLTGNALLLGQNASGADTAATGVTIKAPQSTGSAVAATIAFQTGAMAGSSSTAQTLASVLTLGPSTDTTATTGVPALLLAQTWNNAGTTFTALKVNVTSSAAGGNSTLMDLQVASSSKFQVYATGLVQTAGSVVVGAASALGVTGRSLLYSGADGTWTMLNNAQTGFSYFNRGLAATATSVVTYQKAVASIANAVATDVLTVTVPNTANSASLMVRLTGSLGAGGAIGANEATGTIAYHFSITRTAGVATVTTASTAYGSATSSVAGAATITITAAASAMTGAVGAQQTFTIQVTISRGSGSSTNHTCVVYAELVNANASGITIA